MSFIELQVYNKQTEQYDTFSNKISLNSSDQELDLIDALNYLPDFLKDSPLMLSIIDCLNVLISDDRPIFDEIFTAHNDMMYRIKDFSKLTYQAKIEIVKELGFEYLLDILTLSSDQLTQLLIFFNLIYILKGKREGLEICLKTLGMIYKYEVWDEMDPKGIPFTANLNIIGNNYAESQVFRKIRTFIRSYMLPWINITIELTIDGPPIFVYPSFGVMNRLKIDKPFEATRDVLGIAMYDSEPAYDLQVYGADINTKEEEYIPPILPKYTLTIETIPRSATVIIDGEETRVKESELGQIVEYEVFAEGYGRTSNKIVLTADKTIEVDLNKF